MVFPTFFKPEFCYEELVIWATVSSRSCFCWLHTASPSSATRNVQFTLIHGPNIPGSYAVLFYSIRFYFHPRHIHNWTLFPLWPSLFILSGSISRCPLFPGTILDSLSPVGLIFRFHIFLPFYTVLEVLKASILQWFAIFSSSIIVR